MDNTQQTMLFDGVFRHDTLDFAMKNRSLDFHNQNNGSKILVMFGRMKYSSDLIFLSKNFTVEVSAARNRNAEHQEK